MIKSLTDGKTLFAFRSASEKAPSPHPKLNGDSLRALKYCSVMCKAHKFGSNKAQQTENNKLRVSEEGEKKLKWDPIIIHDPR
jgi:hypothetical protein